MSQLAKIDPEKEFSFILDGANVAKCTLNIKNLVDDNLAFKIKTTVPKSYVVKPNAGIIEGNGELNVSITLTPIPVSVKDHKFMIQLARTSLSNDGLDPVALNAFWKNIKSLEKDAIEDYKLKVVLKSPDFSQTKAAEDNIVVEKKTPGSVSGATPMKQEINIIEEEKGISPDKDAYQSVLENNDPDRIEGRESKSRYKINNG